MKLQVMQEPKGYLKVFEIIFCISSFALIASYQSNVLIDVECYSKQLSLDVTDIFVTENVTVTFDIEVSYPFKFSETAPQKCGKEEISLTLDDETSSQSIFFMFVGVVTFIFILVMIIVYIFEDVFCSNVSWFPVLDLILHFVFIVLWFISSISWSVGLANLRVSTSTESVIVNNEICLLHPCSVSSAPSMNKLVMSVIFGFVTLMTFVGNLWVVFKETNMYKKT